MLVGACIGALAALGYLFFNRMQAKSGSGFPGQVEQAMRGKGPLTLKGVQQLMNRETMRGRGQVATALAGLSSAKKLKTTPAPQGTPQLQKVDFITYEVV